MSPRAKASALRGYRILRKITYLMLVELIHTRASASLCLSQLRAQVTLPISCADTSELCAQTKGSVSALPSSH